MKILLLSLMIPAPANNGHKMRVLGLVKAFVAEGHEVTLLTFQALDEPDGDRALLEKICGEVEIVPIRSRPLTAATDYLRRLRAVTGSEPFAAQRFASPAMTERIRYRLAGGTFDAIVSDSIFSLVNLPPTSTPILLNNVDLEHVILERYARLRSNAMAKRVYAWLESRKLKAWEIDACRRAAVCMACSEHDRAVLEKLCPEASVVVVPNVVDTKSYIPATGSDELTLLYQGAMDWYPNRDAVEFFVNSILPEVRRHTPNVRFVVAGRNPPDAFRKQFAGMPNVELTGTVSDMRPLVGRARVCVVPLRIGSGTRLKILEAAAMEKAVVSTTIGAEGLSFVDGQDILIADEPKAFADALVRLLRDRHLRQALGRRARRRIEREYGFPSLREGIRKAVSKVSCQTAITI